MQTAPASSFISSLYMLFSKINSSRNVYRCYNFKMNFLDRWQDSLPISNLYFCDSVISVAFNMCLYSRSQSGPVSPRRNNDIFNSRASFRSSMRRMEWHIPPPLQLCCFYLSTNDSQIIFHRLWFFCEHYKPLNRLSFASCSVINVIRYYTDCKNYNLAGFICFSPSHTLFGHNALSFDIYLYAVILQHYILYLHSSHIRG